MGSQGFSMQLSFFWIFSCISGFVTRYIRHQEMAIMTKSNPGSVGQGEEGTRNQYLPSTHYVCNKHYLPLFPSPDLLPHNLDSLVS